MDQRGVQFFQALDLQESLDILVITCPGRSLVAALLQGFFRLCCGPAPAFVRIEAQHHVGAVERAFLERQVAFVAKRNRRAGDRRTFVQGDGFHQFLPASDLHPVQAGATAQLHHLPAGGDEGATEQALRLGQLAPLEQVPQAFLPGGFPGRRGESDLQGVRHGLPLLATPQAPLLPAE